MNTALGEYDTQPLIDALRDNGIDEDFEQEDLNKFMCCRKGDVERAVAFVRSHMEWKKEKFGYEAVEKPDAASILEVATSGAFTVPGSRDREGHLIILVRPGRLDLKKHTALDVVRFIWYAVDKAMSDPFSRQNGLVLVEDMGDIGMGFIASAFPSLPREIVVGLMNAIPARVRHVYAQFQPWHLGAAISAVKKTIMPSKLASKFHLCYDNLDKLHQCVAPDQLPVRFGGVHDWDALSADYIATISNVA